MPVRSAIWRSAISRGRGWRWTTRRRCAGSSGRRTKTTPPRNVTWAFVTKPVPACRRYGQAAKWFREAAELGDPAAQFNLGVLYETGQGVTQNYAEAVKWYHAAADQGEPQAQFNLGVFYETGQVVPQNFEEAVKWYELAAEQECAPAQCNLGLCYETGRGVEKNVQAGGEVVHSSSPTGRQDRATQPGGLLRDTRGRRAGQSDRKFG